MPLTLYHHDGHQCLMFSDLGPQAVDEVVQSNQFLIVDQGEGAVLDPGGNLAYNQLYLGMTRLFAPQRLSAILASHADPDIIAALDRWTTATQAPIYISEVWARFVPHFCKPGKTEQRIVAIPDAGMRIPLGRSELWALPAHFLHAEGNFQFYDPVARILFSGDLASSLTRGDEASEPVRRLAEVLPSMEAFHRRYMASNQVLRWWADMVATLDIQAIVPQHGRPLVGEAVAEFIAWARELRCGIDLFGPERYRVPG